MPIYVVLPIGKIAYKIGNFAYFANFGRVAEVSFQWKLVEFMAFPQGAGSIESSGAIDGICFQVAARKSRNGQK